MKFYAEPGHIVNERKLHKQTGKWRNNILFKFDENGEYETTDEALIERMKPHFKHDVFKCKHCNYETENKGELLAHYRKEHPKE